MSVSPSTRDKLLGVGLLVGATMAFATTDLLTKFTIGEVNPMVIIFCRYVAFATLTVPFLWRAPAVSIRKSTNLRLQFMRAAGALGSAILFTSSLIWMPLADAAAIGFVSPLMVVVMSAILLGERVTIGHVLAALTGFGGVLLIIQPGHSPFGWASLIPIGSAFSWAVALTFTRMMSTRESRRVTTAFTALFGLAGTIVILPFVWTPPPAHTIPYLIGLAVAGTLGHVLTVMAYTYMPASRLAPLSYIQLLWVTGLSAVFLNYWPGVWTILGMAMIVASGLYIAGSRIRL